MDLSDLEKIENEAVQNNFKNIVFEKGLFY